MWRRKRSEMRRDPEKRGPGRREVVGRISSAGEPFASGKRGHVKRGCRMITFIRSRWNTSSRSHASGQPAVSGASMSCLEVRRTPPPLQRTDIPFPPQRHPAPKRSLGSTLSWPSPLVDPVCLNGTVSYRSAPAEKPAHAQRRRTESDDER